MRNAEMQTDAHAHNRRSSPSAFEAPTHRESRHVLVDKNLASLGFFTPSSQRIKREKAKTVRFSRMVDGERTDVSATIVPSALHGLPITADQDKFLALQECVRLQRRSGEGVTNPVSFSSAAILRTLGLCDSGRNHLEVSEWLDLMASTTIISEGAVYLSGARCWARDRFRVFERAVSRGQRFEDGSVAERNYVWLSDWQLENINNRYLLPIDLNVYQDLRTHIARALVLHLQVWLYASQRTHVFEKRYTDVCQLLSLRAYDHRSKIVEKLGPALEELATHGYLATWQIARTADERTFKLVLRHGPLFSADHSPSRQPGQATGVRASDAARAGNAAVTADVHVAIKVDVAAEDARVAALQALTERGVTTRKARQLLGGTAPAQDVLRQLEWGDFVIARAAAGTFWNAAGFYVALVRDNLEPPAYFLSARQKVEREEARRAYVEERARRDQLNEAYQHYREREASDFIAAMEPSEREPIVAAEGQDIRSRFPSMSWTPESLRSVADAALRAKLAAELPLMDFGTFVGRLTDQREADHQPRQEASCVRRVSSAHTSRSMTDRPSPKTTPGTSNMPSTSASQG